MNNRVTNILMVGVGGQGILLASEILSEALMLAGHDVKKSEVHGMAQRGGSVVSHVRFGPRVFSPIISEGDADVLFGFELLETFRYLNFLQPDGKVVVNNLRIAPPAVALGKETYPEDIPRKIADTFPATTLVDGMNLASKAGNLRAVNTVLLGALANLLDIRDELWQQAIRKQVPAKFVDVNLRAFASGRSC